MSDLITVDTTAIVPLDFFTGNGVETFLADVREKVGSFSADVDTADGKSEIRSAAQSIARAKVAIDNLGKDAVSGMKKQLKEIDSRRKFFRDSMDEFKAEIRKPLTEIEEAEKRRAEEELRKQQEEEERKQQEMAKKEEELRQREEAIKQKEREEQIRKEAEDRARRDAQAAIERAEADKRRAEEDAKRAKETAEREQQEKIEAAKREEEKRKADKEHREKIEEEIITSLKDSAWLNDDAASSVLECLKNNEIPHVRIQY